MGWILINDQGAIEEDLLTLSSRDPMSFPILGRVALIPFEALTAREGFRVHTQCICEPYTPVKASRADARASDPPGSDPGCPSSMASWMISLRLRGFLLRTGLSSFLSANVERGLFISRLNEAVPFAFPPCPQLHPRAQRR